MVQRVLFIRAGKVANIVGYPDGETVPEFTEGCDVVPAAGTENVGDVFDMTDTLLERRINKQDRMIYQELFRLTNLVRTLNAQGTITVAQYRAFIKTQA